MTTHPLACGVRTSAVAAKLLPKWVSTTLIVFATVTICAAMLEIGLRIMKRYHFENNEGYFAQGGISYVLKKNITKHVVWPGLSFTVHTSEHGFRAKQPGPQPIGERPYCVFMGASDVFGNGLNYEDTFVGVFAERMATHGVDVVNMGVAGHHLLEQMAVLKEFTAATAKKPAAVVIVLQPLIIGGYDDNHPNVLVKRGDLFERDNWRIALARKFMANTSAVYCFFRDGIRALQSRYLKREDFALSFYVERYSTRHRIRAPEKEKDFLAKLKELELYIRELGAEPIIVYSPTVGGFLLNELVVKGQMDPSAIDTEYFPKLARTYAGNTGVKFVNFEPLLQEKYDRGEKLNFEGDAHFNKPTSAALGDFLYQELRPLFQTISKD